MQSKRWAHCPPGIRTHIHEGDLSVRQAHALQPVFEADWEEVGFPEDNSFHPQSILEKALDGRSSEDLRRDVKQFESWMRQLTGETQKEVREQEYEKDLKSDQKTNESPTQQRSREEVDGSGADDAVGKSSTPARNGRDGGGSQRPDSDQTGTEAGMDEAKRPDAPRPTRDTVGGDGAASPDREEVQEVIREVASTLAKEVDGDVLTRHLVMLGTPSTAAVRTQVKEVLQKHVSAEEVTGRRETVEFLSDWLAELGYDIDLPEASAVGEVELSAVNALLQTDRDNWTSSIMTQASVASLYVAYRVAEGNQERWRREEIAQHIHEQHGAVTEEDFPDAVWSETQDEIRKRLEPEEA